MLKKRAVKQKVVAEVVLTIGKQGIVKKYVKEWMAAALLQQAKREGWGHLLTVRVCKVEGK